MLSLAELSDGDLTALTRALHEARFPEVENDPLVWIAPFVIDLHVAAVAEDERRLRAKGDAAGLEAFDSWIQWRGRLEHQTVLRRLCQDTNLRTLVLERGEDYVRRIILPFRADDESISDILRHASIPDTA